MKWVKKFVGYYYNDYSIITRKWKQGMLSQISHFNWLHIYNKNWNFFIDLR